MALAPLLSQLHCLLGRQWRGLHDHCPRFLLLPIPLSFYSMGVILTFWWYGKNNIPYLPFFIQATLWVLREVNAAELYRRQYVLYLEVLILLFYFQFVYINIYCDELYYQKRSHFVIPDNCFYGKMFTNAV